MSIDWCQKCDKRLDTDFVEYQPDGSLYCGACEADIEEEKLQEPDWKALAGELAEALNQCYSQLDLVLPTEGLVHDELTAHATVLRNLLERTKR